MMKKSLPKATVGIRLMLVLAAVASLLAACAQATEVPPTEPPEAAASQHQRHLRLSRSVP
jgi:outer membrane biogenesis lipoprotein LolB